MAVIDRLRAAGFEVYTRRQWGSPRERDGSYARRAASSFRIAGPVPYHFLHITVTRDTDTIKEGAAGARQVETYGYSSPPMVSYQMLVTNEGRIYEGQNYGVKGTHTVNDRGVPGFPEDLNREGYAVALLQNVWDAVTDEQVRSVAACFAAAELEGKVRRGAPIYPHRKFAEKSCPGDKAMARLPEIERLKNQMVRQGLQEDDMYEQADRDRDERIERKLDVLTGLLRKKVKALRAKIATRAKGDDLDDIAADLAAIAAELGDDE